MAINYEDHDQIVNMSSNMFSNTALLLLTKITRHIRTHASTSIRLQDGTLFRDLESQVQSIGNTELTDDYCIFIMEVKIRLDNEANFKEKHSGKNRPLKKWLQ